MMKKSDLTHFSNQYYTQSSLLTLFGPASQMQDLMRAFDKIYESLDNLAEEDELAGKNLFDIVYLYRTYTRFSKINYEDKSAKRFKTWINQFPEVSILSMGIASCASENLLRTIGRDFNDLSPDDPLFFKKRVLIGQLNQQVYDSNIIDILYQCYLNYPDKTDPLALESYVKAAGKLTGDWLYFNLMDSHDDLLMELINTQNQKILEEAANTFFVLPENDWKDRFLIFINCGIPDKPNPKTHCHNTTQKII
ncbi:MAG: hypothetical protein Q8M03_00570 [Legionella sp.]|nr:hypothetical protein [Legionella sp.]